VAIDAIISSVFSTYGVSGVLTLVSVYLLTKLYYLERRYTKLEIDLKEIQKSVENHMSDTREHMTERAKEVDSNMRMLDNKLDSLVNWAISTNQGDVGWLQKRNSND
tara:strand:+ start:317 stop:637 length:321 start_codon:yes stop_codon:yes gene_type:complete